MMTDDDRRGSAAVSNYAEQWGHLEGESWNEEEAIRLLKKAGVEVALHEEGGARTPDRVCYHARIEAAYRSRNMEAYREAVNGYGVAAYEARRQKVQRDSRRSDT